MFDCLSYLVSSVLPVNDWPIVHSLAATCTEYRPLLEIFHKSNGIELYYIIADETTPDDVEEINPYFHGFIALNDGNPRGHTYVACYVYGKNHATRRIKDEKIHYTLFTNDYHEGIYIRQEGNDYKMTQEYDNEYVFSTHYTTFNNVHDNRANTRFLTEFSRDLTGEQIQIAYNSSMIDENIFAKRSNSFYLDIRHYTSDIFPYHQLQDIFYECYFGYEEDFGDQFRRRAREQM